MIKVKVFAILKEILGTDEVPLDFSEGMTCKELLSELEKRDETMASVLHHSFIAVNGCYADLGAGLSASDEVAILPPLSGG